MSDDVNPTNDTPTPESDQQLSEETLDSVAGGLSTIGPIYPTPILTITKPGPTFPGPIFPGPTFPMPTDPIRID